MKFVTLPTSKYAVGDQPICTLAIEVAYLCQSRKRPRVLPIEFPKSIITSKKDGVLCITCCLSSPPYFTLQTFVFINHQYTSARRGRKARVENVR
jgi:hypothetical protein